MKNFSDIALVGALQLNKINEDMIFLLRQKEPGQPDHLAGVDKKLKENRKKGAPKKH